MKNRRPIRRNGRSRQARLVGMAGCFAALAFLLQAEPARPQAVGAAPPAPAAAGSAAPAGEVLDRVVAVVNNQAILASEVSQEIRFAFLDPGAAKGELSPARALSQLISRALIEQQIRQEDAAIGTPSQAEVNARMMELRKELPACMHHNCATDAGWTAFLASRGLTPQSVNDYAIKWLEILAFIERRFQQGIRIGQPEIADYYHNTFLPRYPAGEEAPPLEKIAPRIEEILLQQKVNELFDQWLDDLRKQGDVEVLDPALKSPESPSGGEGSL